MRVNCNWIPILFIISTFASHLANSQELPLMFVAHRGGVVDSSYTESGIKALRNAAKEDYQMIETDMRVTKDGVLIANHDADFKRFYGLDKKVSELNWSEIQNLKSNLDGNVPLQLEEVFRFCHENNLGIMLDNKIAGMDSILFEKLLGLLDHYDLHRTALMIGTDESTDYFTGKIKLSCSRKQLEENMQKPGYQSSSYFLFERPSNLTREDVYWAKSHNIVIVAAINKFHYRQSADMMANAGKDCKRMLDIGIKNFQIDSEFQKFLVQK